MESTRHGEFIVVKMSHGEDLKGNLEEIAKKHKIKGAFIVSCVGMLKYVKLSFFNYPEEKGKYLTRNFRGPFEIGSLTGNLSYFDDRLISHIHASLSGKNFKSISGHIDGAKVNANLEMLLVTFQRKLRRKFDNVIGLKVWNLNKK